MKIFTAAILALSCAIAGAQDRLNEIWTHAQNRVVEEVDAAFEDGEFPKVISVLKVNYADNPRDYDNATNLGWMLENVEEYDQAEAFYKQFIVDNNNHVEAIYTLGNFYSMRRRYDDAIKTLEPTIQNAVHANSFRVLAKAYERVKKYSDAIRIWELQLKKWPDDGPAKANIDRVKKKTG